jgi:hypothetical protein
VITVVNAELVRAIRERRLVELVYKGGRPRTVEPHDYGIRRGACWLLVYQLAGESRSGASAGWKWLSISDIEQLRVLERHFSGTRADSVQQHRDWDSLFARVT